MSGLSNKIHRLRDEVAGVRHSVGVLRKAGLIQLSRPDLLARSARAMRTLGPVAGPASVAAARDRSAVGLVDERGALTYHELDRRSNALARAWSLRGLNEKSVIAVLARDHRGVVDAMLAAGKVGASLLPMNTGFAGPQLVEVARREGVKAIVYDEEFTDLVADLPEDLPRFLAWVDDRADRACLQVPTLDDLIACTNDSPVRTPHTPGRLVMLTSGTGGIPKGAPREITNPLAVATLLERIPLRAGECTVIGVPLFHGTGLSQFIMSFALGSTVVIRRRFDVVAILEQMQRYRATALILVPTLLQRLVEVDRAVIESTDLSALRIILAAGAALSPELGNRAIEGFGNVLYNMYGATEVSVATVAMPEDWQLAPGTIGRPPTGCVVALLDRDSKRITQPRVTGRVFVGSPLNFGGYTDGQRKEVIDGLMSCGDLAHFDENGLFFHDGRDDDMIVSGGENVYPVEIENLLVEHAGVLEAAVVGTADKEFGQRLKAFVVPRQDWQPDDEELKSYVKANLARYKVPREIVFLDELPRNATGKLLRRRLTELG